MLDTNLNSLKSERIYCTQNLGADVVVRAWKLFDCEKFTYTANENLIYFKAFVETLFAKY